MLLLKTPSPIFIPTPIFIDELFLRILGYLIADHAKRTVANLGMTCKELRDTCMDALWKKVESLDHLMVCFPADFWDYRPEYSEEQYLAIPARKPTESDWEKFDFYARKVKILGDIDAPSDDLDLGFPVDFPGIRAYENDCLVVRNLRIRLFTSSQIFNTLMGYFVTRAGVQPLPCLQELIINGRTRQLLPGLHHFLVPGLSRLFIHHSCMVTYFDFFDYSALVAALRFFPTPSLRHLDISREHNSSSYREPFDENFWSNAIMKFNHLETFSSPWTLSDIALLHLASLQCLASLSLWHQPPSNCFATATLDRKSRPSFPALSEFSLSTQNWLAAIPWLDAFTNPVTYLALSMITSRPKRTADDALFRHLQTFLDHLRISHHKASLETLKLRDEGTSLESTQYSDFFDHLLPLFDFNYLRVVHIWYDVDFNDTWIEVAAKSFPRLESLSLKGCNMPIGITPRGLLPLVIHCPFLSILSIPVNTFVREIQKPDWLADEDFSANTKMVEIDVNTWSFTSFSDLVPWLLMMFSSLRKATTDLDSFFFTDEPVHEVCTVDDIDEDLRCCLWRPPPYSVNA